MKNTTARTLAAAFGFATLALAAGCSDDDPSHNEEHAIDEHACIHFNDDTPISATETDSEAPDISAAHTGFLVTLPSGDTPGGFVSYAAGEDAEYGFFVSDGVALEIYDANGNEVAVEEQESGSGTCGITDVFIFDLEVGTYDVFVNPEAGVTSASIVVEEVAHEHEGEDHDHEDEDHDHEDEDHDHAH